MLPLTRLSILESSLNECESNYYQLLELKTDLETSFETQPYLAKLNELVKKTQALFPCTSCTCKVDQTEVLNNLSEISKNIQVGYIIL
ncbi:hypothetical protein HMI56_005608 [Coelomomyces lativittatus]|nr:hypothetical protein HMI56_005608 [Coelomomyces lativittatus]